MGMIAVTAAHVITGSFNLVLFPRGHLALKRRQQQLQVVLRCAMCPEKRRESRRLVTTSLLLVLFHSLSAPKDAVGGSILDKYVKKKKLDPLEAYVPAVILAQLQIQELGPFLVNKSPTDGNVWASHLHSLALLLNAVSNTLNLLLSFRQNFQSSINTVDSSTIYHPLGQSLEANQPRYADCRSLLRSGPAASLRVNIRAVAQYASDGGKGKSAFNNVDQCLRSLEELDSLLLLASRNESDASIESMKAKIRNALNALDSLLDTVPSDVLSKGKAIADAYQPREDVEPDNQDPELKQLESLL